MPVISAPAEDKRLARYAWLLKICYAGKTFQFLHSAGTRIFCQAPDYQLRRALRRLIAIIDTQVEGYGFSPRIRPGSDHYWWSTCTDHETDPSEHTFDPQADNVGSPVDPNTEIFPEMGTAGGRPAGAVTDELRASRYELLKRMKKILYDAQDNGASIQEAWKALWNLFMYAMSSNRYLLQWHNGEVVSDEWKLLGPAGQQAFLTKTFNIDAEAMVRWDSDIDLSTVEDSACHQANRFGFAAAVNKERSNLYQPPRGGALGDEIEVFFNAILTRLPLFIPFALQKGHDEECANVTKRFQEVTDRSELNGDDGCPICLLDYELTSEITTADPDSHVIPVKMPCNHIVCGACAKRWADSDANNKDKCPTCRAAFVGSNPHEKHRDDLRNALTILSSDVDAMQAQETAKGLIQAVKTYVYSLPTSISDVAPTPTSVDAHNLFCWRQNILELPMHSLLYTGGHINIPFEEDDDDVLTEILQAQRPLVALQCMHLSLQRLQAHMEGDQDKYRETCKNVLRAHAHLENLAFCIALHEWTEEFQEVLEEEEEERRAAEAEEDRIGSEDVDGDSQTDSEDESVDRSDDDSENESATEFDQTSGDDTETHPAQQTNGKPEQTSGDDAEAHPAQHTDPKPEQDPTDDSTEQLQRTWNVLLEHTTTRSYQPAPDPDRTSGDDSRAHAAEQTEPDPTDDLAEQLYRTWNVLLEHTTTTRPYQLAPDSNQHSGDDSQDQSDEDPTDDRAEQLQRTWNVLLEHTTHSYQSVRP